MFKLVSYIMLGYCKNFVCISHYAITVVIGTNWTVTSLIIYVYCEGMCGNHNNFLLRDVAPICAPPIVLKILKLLWSTLIIVHPFKCPVAEINGQVRLRRNC